MSLSVKDIAGALKLETQVVERLAKYLYPNKVLLTHDEALVLRDYYYKFGTGPAGTEIGPYNEWMKLERMKALIRARLEVIEEKQSACVTKLNTLSGVYPGIDDMLPVKVSPRGHDAGGLLKFPVLKTTARNMPKKERASGFFGGLPARN
ncbi:MAG: hypothetical protein LBH20_03430 [Treponema sp.]|jgi:hypothetical protein|nr:hypothetical protein [Treponema sp.]